MMKYLATLVAVLALMPLFLVPTGAEETPATAFGAKGDGPGLLLRNVTGSLVTGCLIADRRPDRTRAPSLRVEGGQDNTLANNKLAQGEETVPAAASN